jgi:hypothetical protein
LDIDSSTPVEDVKQALAEKLQNTDINTIDLANNKSTYNAFFNLSIQDFKKLFPQGEISTKIEVNFMIFKIEIARSVYICYRCGSYGHVAKNCKSESPRCTHCAGKHEFTECPNRKSSCARCIHCKDQNHASTNLKCPLYKKHFTKMLSRFQ